MKSKEALLFIALKDKNYEQAKKLMENMPTNMIIQHCRTSGKFFWFDTRELLQAINNPLASSNPIGNTGFGKEDFGNANLFAGAGNLLSDIANALNNMLNNFLGHFSHPSANIWYDMSVSATIRPSNPMAIDLDGEGIETVDINNSQIYFDVDNDGFREQTGWISKNEAILAIDKNGNGKIDNQSEMFGSTEKTGFEELKELDTNNDGIIDSNDTDFDKIRIWQDLNGNGVTDERELKTAAEAGIKSISLNSSKMSELNSNNIITEKARITYTDGSQKNLYDVATQYNDMYTVYGGDYILDADVIDLPWLRGYGNSIDLQLAASQNDDLKALVKQMASMTNSNDIYNQFDNMMSMWLGENKTGEEMQKLILSKLIRLDITDMGEFQTNNITYAYESLKNKLFVQFIAQTGIADKFDIAYDYPTDTIIYSDNTYENIVRNTADSDAFNAAYIIAKMLADDDTLVGGTGNDFLSGSTGNDTFLFNKGDGIDTVNEYAGEQDVVKLGDQVTKTDIAIYKDTNNNLIIDYGENAGFDQITVLNQFGSDKSKLVERFELNDGSYMTDADINALIQNMTAYANNNAIEFTGIESVKNNADLMNLVASAWHS